MCLLRMSMREINDILGQVLEIPRMFLDLFHGYSLDRVRLEHPIDEVLNVRRYIVGHVILPFFNLVEELRHAIVIERKTSTHHCEQDHSQRPNVYFHSTVGPSADNFRCGIVRRSTSSLKGLGVLHGVCQAEVNKLDVVILIQ